jgi:3-oxoacyl-[acyl-carrier protein] reductase
MPKILSGKVALITGGSRGIGAAIVRRLARDGASVAFTYGVSEDRAKMLAAEVEAVGGKVLPVKADSADAEAVKRAVAQTINSLGRLDILVNNAEFSLAAGWTTTASRTSTGWSR